MGGERVGKEITPIKEETAEKLDQTELQGVENGLQVLGT